MAIGTLGAIALGVGALGSGIAGASAQSRAAGRAADAQTQAAMAAIDEQRQAREEMRRLLQPYLNAGGPALTALMDLAGLGGSQSGPFGAGVGPGSVINPPYATPGYVPPGVGGNPPAMTAAERQAAAIAQQEANPLFQGLVQQGENAILQNAAATGGLRGGNVQGALGQFRPQLLNQFIEQQYGRLQGIAGMGQNAAAGVGAGFQNAASQIGSQFGNIGAAQAGAALARGQAQANMFAAPFGALGLYKGLGGKLF